MSLAVVMELGMMSSMTQVMNSVIVMINHSLGVMVSVEPVVSLVVQ